jgi:hypothetical protein
MWSAKFDVEIEESSNNLFILFNTVFIMDPDWEKRKEPFLFNLDQFQNF